MQSSTCACSLAPGGSQRQPRRLAKPSARAVCFPLCVVVSGLMVFDRTRVRGAMPCALRIWRCSIESHCLDGERSSQARLEDAWFGILMPWSCDVFGETEKCGGHGSFQPPHKIGDLRTVPLLIRDSRYHLALAPPRPTPKRPSCPSPWTSHSHMKNGSVSRHFLEISLSMGFHHTSSLYRRWNVFRPQ